MTQLEAAVLKTLIYVDIFDQALTTDELTNLLVRYKLDSPDRLKSTKVTGASQKRNLWALSSRRHLFEYKDQQQAIQNLKVKQAKRWLWVFKLIPWIELVAITGSVAGGSPQADDDIDLLIITDKNRLWLSRLCLLPLLSMLRVRRRPSDDPTKVSNKLCLNMWRSTTKLKEEHRDLYTAMELARMIPILNRSQAYQRYIASNSWMVEILPNWQPLKESGIRPARHASQPRLQTPSFGGQVAGVAGRNQESDDTRASHSEQREESRDASAIPQQDGLWSRTFNKLDYLAESIQLKLMRPRTNETVKSTELKFHPRDYRSEILKKYQLQLEKLNI